MLWDFNVNVLHRPRQVRTAFNLCYYDVLHLFLQNSIAVGVHRNLDLPSVIRGQSQRGSFQFGQVHPALCRSEVPTINPILASDGGIVIFFFTIIILILFNMIVCSNPPLPLDFTEVQGRGHSNMHVPRSYQNLPALSTQIQP